MYRTLYYVPHVVYGVYLGKDIKILPIGNFIILPVPTILGIFHEI